jgi:hypothetical protein
MAELTTLQFVLLRYAPDVLSDVGVEIALIAQADDFLDVRFRKYWSAVLRLDPGADVEYLDALKRNIKRKFASGNTQMLGLIESSFSNLIRCSARKFCLCEDPAAEVDKLVAMYLTVSGSAAIARRKVTPISEKGAGSRPRIAL